jgi:chromosome segregation and condensation protein ScpB
MTSYITVQTPRAIGPKPARKTLAPKLTPEQDAARIRSATRRAWGETSKYTPPEQAKTNRAAWIAAIAPHMPVTRANAADIWGVTIDGASDRLRILGRAGMIERIAGRPMRWVMA